MKTEDFKRVKISESNERRMERKREEEERERKNERKGGEFGINNHPRPE